jgi:hypothetical protein
MANPLVLLLLLTGGHHQWQVTQDSPMAPAAQGAEQVPIMMLTSDISLMNDAR